MIRADFHTHTCFSTDSETPVREMIEHGTEVWFEDSLHYGSLG